MVEPPRVRRPEVQPYTPEEGRLLRQAVAANRLEALYSAAMALGLLQGEALGLKWSDVDFSAGALTVRNSLQRVNGKRQASRSQGAAKPAHDHATAIAVAALLRHQARQQKSGVRGPALAGVGLCIFTTTIGTPLDGTTVTHRFRSMFKAAGLRRMRFHDLRHTCATLMLAQGVHPRLIMEILGHSQIAVTMNLDAHVIPAMQKEVAPQMDAVLAPKKPVAAAVATKPPTSEAVN